MKKRKEMANLTSTRFLSSGPTLSLFISWFQVVSVNASPRRKLILSGYTLSVQAGSVLLYTVSMNRVS